MRAVPGSPAATLRRPALWRELVLGLVVFALYSVISGLDWSGRKATAFAHAHQLYRFERWLGIDIEPPLNHWLQRHDILRVLANYEYAITYILSAFALLIWLYLRRPELYRWARTSFVLVNLIAVVVFALYPLAPPRLLPDQGFFDTVSAGHTWGSWGSSLVDHANEIAAMPSLHLGWALWVSVVLALIHGGARTQVVSLVHVLVTLFVIMATANHYLLDAVGGGLLVLVSVPLAGALSDRRGVNPWRAERVPAADAFFLAVETPAAPQHVGGLVFLEQPDGQTDGPTRDAVVELIKANLPALPRFTQQLQSTSRWRRRRWLPAAELDWDYHVEVRDISGPNGEFGGIEGVQRVVADIAGTTLPRDRPLWRFVIVHGVAPGLSAGVFIVHHVVADGFGTVSQALQLLEPPLPPRPTGQHPRPGRFKSALAVCVGLAQLATDSKPKHRLRQPPTVPPGGTVGAPRDFTVVALELARVRAIAARLQVRITDLLLTVVAGAIARSLPAGNGFAELRTSVPLMVREPDADHLGNVTAAVMLDVPLGIDLSEPQRLALTARRSSRLRTGTRALASRFVMSTVGELMPPPIHTWFARSVYNERFFHAIVSNMPGPAEQLSLASCDIRWAYPILPLAPGVPIAAGALGWGMTLCLSVTSDPGFLPDVAVLASAVEGVLAELEAAPTDSSPPSSPAQGSSAPRFTSRSPV